MPRKKKRKTKKVSKRRTRVTRKKARTTRRKRKTTVKNWSLFVKRERKAHKRTWGKSRTVKPKLRQIGKSNTRIDKRFVAKKPGKRITAWGSVYYEYRRNRSDKNRKKRL